MLMLDEILLNPYPHNFENIFDGDFRLNSKSLELFGRNFVHID